MAGLRSPMDARRAMLFSGSAVLIVAAAMFSRFGLEEELRRDEAVFAYAGQQLAEGVPPYVSILDAKTPLASFIAGGAVIVGRAVGADDLVAIRLAFFLVACLTVVAIHLAATLLFRSVTAGLGAAAAFLTFKGFAIDALGGPNAKTPGVLLGALTTVFVVRRHWFSAGFSASFALLVWQPLAVYALVVMIAALAASEAEDRWRSATRAALGIAVPGLATLGYFAAAGALPQLVEGAILLPTVGRPPAEGDLGARVGHIIEIVAVGYGLGGTVVWLGLAGLAFLAWRRARRLGGHGRALAADRLLLPVMFPLVALAGLSLVDFQGYPDVYPLLPYAAFGIGGIAALALRRAERTVLRDRNGDRARAGALGLLAVILVGTWAWYSEPRAEGDTLVAQRADAAAAERLLRPGDTLRVLGSPAPLVLMNRRNPSSGIYLSAGIDRWVAEHHAGGFPGWAAEVASSDMVVVGGWSGDYLAPMREVLAARLQRLRIGGLELHVVPSIRERARAGAT